MRALRLTVAVYFVLLVGAADRAAAQFGWEPAYAPPYRGEPVLSQRRPPGAGLAKPLRSDQRKKKKQARRDVRIPHPFGKDMPKGPLQLMVSLTEQRAVLYSNGVRVADSRISSGTRDHPTPTGVFSVIQKSRWHESNIYSNAPMYYMHRLTWSGIALHEGHLPGRPASHGCIRLPTDFVSRLWNVSKLGMRVVVSHEAVAPVEISHAKLFNPPAASAAGLSQAVAPLRPTFDMFGRDGALVRVSGREPMDAPAATDSPTTHAPAAPAMPASGIPSAGAAADPAAAGGLVQEEASDPPLPPPAPSRIRAEAAKNQGQVAVFVSRREKRVFVRLAFQPLFDMPVEIADPDKPLGTHTYTAIELTEGGRRMRWNVISMPQASSPKGRGKARTPEPGAVAPSDAVAALDRITIPQAAIDRISELLVPGSSLIISDQGLGRETGRYTEFIVETP